MPDKVDVTIAIEIYRMEMNDYFKWYAISFIVMIICPIPGIIWFVKRIKKKKKLDEERKKIIQMLQEISNTIPLDEYFQLRKRLNTTRSY